MKTTCIACFTLIVGLLSLSAGNSEAQIGNPALSGQLEPGQPDISEYPLQLRGQQSTQGVSGAIADASLEVSPSFEPTTQDVVVLTVLGYWVDTPRRVIAHDHTIDGNLVTLNIYAVLDPVQISFSVSELIGQLPAGLYDVEVLLHGVETILITTFTIFPYTPPSLIWDEDERLTDNDLSDSAPKSTWHDGEIHLLWNHSYDCMVRHGVFDATGLHDLENIASCPTGSGPGVVSFEDTLLGFYAQGEYPVYNLFGKAIDPAAAQFQLTFGDLYDRYGAAALIYEDALHLFWKRWVETGYRHVFHRTYDGESWSDGVFVTEDYYFDTRPTAAVYNGEIYLFYLGGSQFRTFDGASWSDATLLFNGGDGNVTPAACTLNGFLFLLFRYDGQMYYKRFDGSEWTAARTVPSAPADEPRDLECIASDDELYLFWGSRYSWPRSELFAKRAVPEPNQMLFMATAIVVLAQLKRRRRTRS